METLASFLQAYERHFQITRIEEVQQSNGIRNPVEEQRLLENVESLMHQLTPWNFDQVKDQLVQSIRRNPSAFILQGLVSCIFDLAVAYEAYILFGPLCADLSVELPCISSDEPCGRYITFKRLFLNKCQMEFENAISQTDLPHSVYDEETFKVRLIGTLRLLAEGFKWRMVPEKICHHIIQELMRPTCPPEGNIEAIYQFLSFIGKQVDAGPKSRRILDLYFDKLKELVRNPQLTPRSRVMILYLHNLRANNWVKTTATARFPRGEDKNQELFLCVAATSNDGASVNDVVGEPEPESSEEGDHLLPSKAEEDVDNNACEKFGKAMVELRISKHEAYNERLRRIAAEKDASEAIHKAGVLENKYTDELKLRKETEDLLARERKEMEMLKQLLETFKRERDNFRVERDNALKLAEDLLTNQTSLPSFFHSDEHQTRSFFFCPISQEVMKDPQVAADGFTYEAVAIRQWLDNGHDTSPMTNLRLSHRNLVPNHALRAAIQEWLQQQH